MSGISVIIPAYNRAHLLGETLRSLLNQTLPADEIIVVDDGSTGSTAEAARAAFVAWKSDKAKGKRSPEFKILFQENAGPAAARNTGFRVSQGEFIHFFDSDDLAAHNKQEIQLTALEKSGADIAIGPWLQGHFAGTSFMGSKHVLQQNGLPRESNLVKALLSYWTFVPHASLFRRSIVEKAGGFPEELFVGEDQMMFLKCLLAGAKVVHTPETLEFYRVGESDKITERQDLVHRHLLEWARFLVKARESCLAKGINPLDWFEYRCRLWQSLQDLRKIGFGEDELPQSLRDIAPSGLDGTICHWHRQIKRWKGGILQRITGGRSHSSFRAAPMTSCQIDLLLQLGYSYNSSSRASIF